MKCTGLAMVGQQCPHEARWRNHNGVEVCGHHKLELDAFTWESRNKRKWHPLDLRDRKQLEDLNGMRQVKVRRSIQRI